MLVYYYPRGGVGSEEAGGGALSHHKYHYTQLVYVKWPIVGRDQVEHHIYIVMGVRGEGLNGYRHGRYGRLTYLIHIKLTLTTTGVRGVTYTSIHQ